jgi:hypothetical protein
LLFACIIFMCEQGNFIVNNDYPQGTVRYGIAITLQQTDTSIIS